MKYKIQKLLLTIISLFMIVTSGAFAQKSIKLVYNLNVGDNYSFISDINQDITFDAMGTTTTLEQVMMFEMSSVVNKIEGNDISEEYAFNRIKMDQKIFGMEIIYDSRDSTTFEGMGAQIAEQMNKIIGAQIYIVKNNRGKVLDIDLSKFSNNSDLANSLSSGNTHAIYPEGKIKVGDSWESDINTLEDSEMKVHVVYTLKKVSRKHAELDVEGTVTANDIEEELSLTGTTTGSMTVDRKTGMLISSTIDLDMSLDIDQGGVTIPATIMGTTNTTVSKVK
jgi:hypothetical protein